jgi:diacylglycerol kinase
MNAKLTGRDRGFWAGRWFSLRAALAGVLYTLRTQPNAWIELCAVLVVSLTGWWMHLSLLEWGILGLTFFLVLALESLNTAVEAVVDLVSPDYHPLAKVAKDAAAGAMVFVVLGSVCVALVIFSPRLWALFF